jgi:isopentenyl-diphosphate delta-isomerase
VTASADASILVELVDEQGRALGTMPKLAAHAAPGHLHRAISVFLLDEDGRLLLQRRAAGKYHSGGLWSNTCCSHPAPGEAPLAAGVRRVGEELGVATTGLAEAGTVIYRVSDPVSGLVEHEYNHLLVGRTAGTPDPDPAEVGELTGVTLDELARMRAATPFTAWFPAVLDAVRPALEDLTRARTA